MPDFREEVTKCLLAIKNDDHTMFERLVKLTNAPLKNLARRYLLNDSFCDDVVSEVYLNITIYAAAFKPKDDKDGYRYLWSVVRNNAYDINKDILKHQTVSIEIIQFFDTTDLIEQSNLKMDIASALKQLPYKDAMVIIWTYIYDLTQEQIGEMLDVSKSAVCQRLDKAKEKLKNILSK